VVRENHWDDIVKAYRAKGIDVHKYLRAPLVRYFEAKGFQFTKEQVVAFYAALKTKGFVILSGLSGTGKTKLAQLFSELFTFEQEVEPEIGEGEIVLTVQPYMLKYRRFIIPVGYWNLLPSLSVGEQLTVEVIAEGVSESCRLKRWEHPAHEQGYMQLLIRGKVYDWFADNLREGDKFRLQLDYDDDGNLRCVKVSKLQKVKKKEPAYCFLSVRPDWRDSKALLGYYNPLTGSYESTPLLHFLKQACEDKANPYFVILDEMNLAHVEYYFADFLSVLESGRDEEGRTKEALRLHSFGKSILDQDGYLVPPELRLPPNLYIIGTVNIDETTYMFSPKVLDRAFTLEFREVDFGNYPPEGTDKSWTPEQTEKLRQNILEDLRIGGKFCAVVADKDEVKKALQNLGGKKAELRELNDTLQPYDLHFGYRVLDEIALFVQNATQAPDDVGKLSEDESLDYAVLMKVLPKFHGPRQKLEKPLRELLRWAQNRKRKDDSNKDAPSWVGNPDEVIDLRKISEALQNWEPPKQPQDQAQPATEQAENKPEGQAEQTATAQQEQGNQTEATTTQAAQGETKGQSEASTAQPFKEHFLYANTAKKVLQMLRQLYETGFASFAQ
jgi:energy-coupling factor transporter ATP-binding protein EcfA2